VPDERVPESGTGRPESDQADVQLKVI